MSTLTLTFNRLPPKSIGSILSQWWTFLLSLRRKQNSLVSIVFSSLSPYMSIVTLTFWPLTLKINRVHPLTMVNMSAKFDQEAHNGFVAIVFTRLFPHMSIVTLTFDVWPPKSIGFIISPWLTCLPSLIKSTQRYSRYRVHNIISIYVHCDLDLWPLTSKINRVHPLTMVNMSAKFDKEIHNGLVSIVFTSSFQYMSIVTLTFDLWPPKSLGFILSPWLTCLPSLIKKHTMV